MDRSEVKLSKINKIVISHILNESLKQKNFTGKWALGDAKTFESFFFFETIFMSKL